MSILMEPLEARQFLSASAILAKPPTAPATPQVKGDTVGIQILRTIFGLAYDNRKMWDEGAQGERDQKPPSPPHAKPIVSGLRFRFQTFGGSAKVLPKLKVTLETDQFIMAPFPVDYTFALNLKDPAKLFSIKRKIAGDTLTFTGVLNTTKRIVTGVLNIVGSDRALVNTYVVHLPKHGTPLS